MGYIYTFLQFAGIGLIIFTPPFLPQSILGQVILILSVVLGLWSIYVFRHTKINVFPYLRDGSTIIRSGPYRYLRHPMYTSVILFALSYFIDNPNWMFGLYFLGIVIVLLFKMNFEEKHLSTHFEEYEVEFFKIYRIIPCVY